MMCCVVSSAVVWEGGYGRKHFRPLASKLSQHLEESYSQYLVSVQTDRSARKSRVLQRELNFDVIQTTIISSVSLVYKCNIF